MVIVDVDKDPAPRGNVDNNKDISNPFPSAKRKWVEFFNTGGDDGKGPIDFQVNGYPFRIPRETPVHLPEWVFPAINDAISEIMDPDTGEMRKVMRFPYRELHNYKPTVTSQK